MRIALIAMLVLFLATIAVAQEESIKTTQLTDTIYLLTTDQGEYTTNVIALVGDDGVLLVDAQAESDAPALKERVDAFGKGLPKYIINTHRHVEHVGGNAIFGEEPVVIAHSLVPKKLRSGSYLFNEFPKATFPDITIEESMTLFFNGERIEITAFGGSHDDNEIIVHFVESKIVHLSSVVNGFNFPSVDGAGDPLAFAEFVARAMEILPHDVTIVSGHNDPGRWEELAPYHEMLVKSEEVVRAGLAAGKDLATLQQEKVLEPWEHYAGSYVSADEWTEYLVEAIQDTGARKASILEVLYHAWKADGAAAAVDRYTALKRDKPDEYDFSEWSLVVAGNKLLGKDHVDAAVTFLEAGLEENAEWEYAYWAQYRLAAAYRQQGDVEKAKACCEKSLELNPEFAAAAEMLEELRGE